MSENLPAGKPAEAEEPFDLLQSFFEWVELFVFSFALVLVVITLFIRHAPVDGTSMTHTLEDRDLVLVNELFYTPKQGDIVVVQSQTHGFAEPLVKRVIAVGGQTVDIDFDTWTVYVDGEEIEEDYVRYLDRSTMNDVEKDYAKRPGTLSMLSEGMTFPKHVPEGYVFVLGDNRNNSLDSRSPGVGLIDSRCVVGRVFCRLFPFNKIGIF